MNPFTPLKRALRNGYYFFHQLYFLNKGGKVACNICGFTANHLNDDSWHRQSICPRCGSGVRQRLLWNMLQHHPHLNLGSLVAGKKVLHFAPEKILREKLRKAAGSYETADYFAEGYYYPGIDHCLDISDMPQMATSGFDCVIACDVLEHVPDDARALKEVWRVLRPGGCCILTVPQKDHAKSTDGDTAVTDPAEREKQFGQRDHFRIYGADIAELIQKAGFEVFIVDEKDFSREQVERHVLFPPILSKHPLATNYRKVYVGKKP